MGLLQAQSALVCYTESTEDLARRNYAILDLGTFQIIPIPEPATSRFRFYRDKVHLRPNENFSAVTIWSTSQTPTGLLFARLSGLGLENPLYRHENCGSLSIDRQGRKIYSTLGNIYSPESTSATTYPGASLFAVRGGDFFLEVRKRQVVVRESPGAAEVSRFEIPYEFAVAEHDNDKLTDDRLVQASAQLNRACFVDLKNTAAYVFELGLGADRRQVREAPDAVARGALWTRKMHFPAGTRVTLEDAPKGLKYEPSDATLSWQIPSTQPAGEVLILLNVTLPGKDEAYQRVTLRVQ